MKIKIAIGTICLFLGSAAQAQTPRQYFEELKAVNGFNHYSDEYVCFESDAAMVQFYVVSKVSSTIQRMKKNNNLSGARLGEGFKNDLSVQIYYKGVLSDTDFYNPVGTEGIVYSALVGKPSAHIGQVFSFNWSTGRYRRTVYREKVPVFEFAGKCELIHPEVP